uniref:Uncharacterized protein n=1 Tax=Trichobilharzia regenti TaxID=157069 RepID=A0AA85K7J6_TRIRE|nr:unnamed protein product [Trichobilharzia regenti]
MSIFDGSSTIERIKGKIVDSCNWNVIMAGTSNKCLFMTLNSHSTGINDFSKKPMSLRGYTLGARTAPRLTYQVNNTNVPDPGAYQNYINKTLTVKPNKKPFNSCAPRSNISPNVTSTVGVGTYDITSEIGRRVQWQRDTMLHPVNLPTIEQKSTISVNTDKLATTAEHKRYQRKLAYLQLYFK